MSDRGIHPRNLADLIDTWDLDGDGTLGQQIQEAAESHNLTQARPRIIRTIAELEALDPDTLLISPHRDYPISAGEFLNAIEYDIDYGDDLPAVVVAPADQARAARKALEEA